MTPRGVLDDDLVELESSVARVVRRRSLRLLGSMLRPLRLRVIGLLALVVLAQAARAAGPFLIALSVNVALPRLQDGDATKAYVYGGLLLAAAIGGGVLAWLSISLTAWVSQHALLDLRRRTFRHVQKLSLEFHEQYTSGRAIARQTSDLEAIRELLDSGINQLLSSFVYMVVVATMLTILDPWSGAILLVAAVPAWFLTRWFHRQSALHYRSTRVTSANLIVQFVETMTGIKAVQAFRREGSSVEDHRRVSDDYRDADNKAMSLTGVYDPTLILIGNLTVATVLAVDGYRVLSGELPVGTLIAAVLYAQRFFSPLEQMARFYNSFQAAVASLEKISGLLEEEPDLDEPEHPKALTEAAGRLEMSDVTFGYVEGRPTVEHLNLVIPAGQTIAFVGGTGAGKSTLAKLIARFYDVDSGAVLLDGVDVRDLSFADLRRHVVVVTQESFVFSGTIADNIALGRPDATREEIERAARAVGAHGFIQSLPEGYDTDVHKRGGRLSAGQRQLVSFARAFIADPTVLVLDEATSSLDLPSEMLIQRALDVLLRGRTAIVIAHRLSTIENADRILVLDHGAIAEDGAPAHLEAADGPYAHLRRVWARGDVLGEPGQRSSS